MSLNIYTSNRMENLAQALSMVLRRPLVAPLSQEIIVVQSRGMERWLAMELAQRFGTWANCRYPFPNAMVQQLFQQALPGLTQSLAFSPEVMSWRIIACLPALLSREEFRPLKHYLDDDKNGLKLYQLATKIADVFDQYTMFRPQLIAGWEEGKESQAVDEQWQAYLWRELNVDSNGCHRGQLSAAYHQQMSSGSNHSPDLPARISLFGISYLPQYHLDVLTSTAKCCEINLFLLSPTREYWSDLLSNKEQASLTLEERSMIDYGSSLLSSLGRLGRDFSGMVIDTAELATIEKDLYSLSENTSLLGLLQNDILNLNTRLPGAQKTKIKGDDKSVQFHSCHSPLREIEVLHDQILNLLEQHELEPRDILVMTPDIEIYAPYINTVFTTSHDKIPFSIADRSYATSGEVVSVVLKILQLPDSRLSVLELLDILETLPVGKRFDLGVEELKLIRFWLAEVEVRWGLDRDDRVHLGLPDYDQNSLCAGIKRLLLGYAMPENGRELYGGVLPYSDIEGGNVATLGKFCDYVECIENTIKTIKAPCSLAIWGDRLRTLVKDFIAEDKDSAQELTQINDVVATLNELENNTAFTDAVSLDVVRDWFVDKVDQAGQNFGFMTGGVTFCAMLPMRSIPFKVIALIGMNDGAFPRQGRQPSFDLVSQHPQRGDRSLRDEDRYLFLEALLSARNCFYLSYVGQSIKDNSSVPPSVLVSELIDTIEQGFVVNNADNVDATPEIIVSHKLQAFNPAYFDNASNLFSYSVINCLAQQQQQVGNGITGSFISSPLDDPPDEWRHVSLTKLVAFFANPTKFFFEQRLGIRFPRTDAPLSDREPFAVVGLEDYSLKEELLYSAFEGENLDKLLPIMRAQGILPPGEHGATLYKETAKIVSAFATTITNQTKGQGSLADLDFSLDLKGFCLSGRLNNLSTEHMLRYRCTKTKPKDLFRTWIQHLILNVVDAKSYPLQTRLIMTDKETGFQQVKNAEQLLISILDLYWQGLRLPLQFFPQTSMAYAKKWQIEAAHKVWEGGDYSIGEKNDPYYQRCYGDNSPLDENFEQVSRLLLEPMLLHTQ